MDTTTSFERTGKEAPDMYIPFGNPHEFSRLITTVEENICALESMDEMKETESLRAFRRDFKILNKMKFRVDEDWLRFLRLRQQLPGARVREKWLRNALWEMEKEMKEEYVSVLEGEVRRAGERVWDLQGQLVDGADEVTTRRLENALEFEMRHVSLLRFASELMADALDDGDDSPAAPSSTTTTLAADEIREGEVRGVCLQAHLSLWEYHSRMVEEADYVAWRA